MVKTASCITWAEISPHLHSIRQQRAIAWFSTQVAFLFFYSKHVFSIDKYTSRQRKIATEEVAQWQLPALLSRRWLVRILLRAIFPIFYHFNSALHSINKCNAKCIHKPVSSVVVGKELIYCWIVGSIPCSFEAAIFSY